MAAMDDADGRVVGMWFSDVEDTEGYLHVQSSLMEHRGVPMCVYVDGHSVFTPTNPGKLTLEEELSGNTQGRTQMGRILQGLGVKVIVARSAQAKGRIERLWGTLQDRLVIELRLAGISTIDEANAAIPNIIARFNRRFSVSPREEASSYRPSPPRSQWEALLALREERTVAGDSIVSFRGRSYQLCDRSGRVQAVRRGKRVEVAWPCQGGDPWITMDGRRFEMVLFERAARVPSPPQVPTPRRPTPPREDHPWRRSDWLTRGPRSPAASTPADGCAPGRPGGAARPAASQ
jgi:hypothetical protein